MIAVIKTGGKQYKVAEGDTIVVERLAGEDGDTIKFEDVLFIGDDADVTIGEPTIAGATVEGKIIEQGRNKKVWGIKHKPKKRFMMKFGHKQLNTKVEITKVAK